MHFAVAPAASLLPADPSDRVRFAAAAGAADAAAGAAAAAGVTAAAGAAAGVLIDLDECFATPPWPEQAPRPDFSDVVPSLQSVALLPAAAAGGAAGAAAAVAAGLAASSFFTPP